MSDVPDILYRINTGVPGRQLQPVTDPGILFPTEGRNLLRILILLLPALPSVRACSHTYTYLHDVRYR